MPVRSVRRRYLYVQYEFDSILQEEDLNQVIGSKSRFLYGVKGASELNFRLIENIPHNRAVIIRCNHNRLNEMRTVLAHISKVKESDIRFDVKSVSGTIKALKKHVAN